MSGSFMRGLFKAMPRPATSVGTFLLFSLLIAGPSACESTDPAPRVKSSVAGEVFEAFDSDAVIEEETIAPPPSPRPALLPPESVNAAPSAPDLYPAPPPVSGPGATAPLPAEDAGRGNRRLPLSSPGAAPPGAAPAQPQSAD